jgi:hypothetical protein
VSRYYVLVETDTYSDLLPYQPGHPKPSGTRRMLDAANQADRQTIDEWNMLRAQFPAGVPLPPSAGSLRQELQCASVVSLAAYRRAT